MRSRERDLDRVRYRMAAGSKGSPNVSRAALGQVHVKLSYTRLTFTFKAYFLFLGDVPSHSGVLLSMSSRNCIVGKQCYRDDRCSGSAIAIWPVRWNGIYWTYYLVRTTPLRPRHSLTWTHLFLAGLAQNVMRRMTPTRNVYLPVLKPSCINSAAACRKQTEPWKA